MSQLIIETDHIKKAMLYILAFIGVLAIAGMLVSGAMNLYHSQQAQPVVVPVTEPVVTTVPTAVPTSIYPSIIQFTVLSTTVANGHYSVFTTTGQTLYMPDYYSWNSLWPRNTYTATVIGTEPNGALDVSTINLVSTPSSYPMYFHYNLNYYQYDGQIVDLVHWKETIGHPVIEGRPPGFREWSL